MWMSPAKKILVCARAFTYICAMGMPTVFDGLPEIANLTYAAASIACTEKKNANEKKCIRYAFSLQSYVEPSHAGQTEQRADKHTTRACTRVSSDAYDVKKKIERTASKANERRNELAQLDQLDDLWKISIWQVHRVMTFLCALPSQEICECRRRLWFMYVASNCKFEEKEQLQK